MAGPPGEMLHPSLGEQLDTRLARDAAALAHLADRIAVLARTVAAQSADLADAKQIVAHLQRSAGRFP
jgi:hypothetical protein